MTDTMQDYINQVYQVSHLVPQKKKLIENGYRRYITQQGCLWDDELWVHPDTIKAYKEGTRNPKYIFTYKEKYLNEWSSTQIQRRSSKLSKAQIKFLAELEENLEL